MRVLGLDIGTRSIKAVSMEVAFRRYQVLDYFEEKIEANANSLDGIQRMVAGLSKMPDRVAVALPNRQVTFRNLKLPTRDKKAIQTTLAFELEDELPFPLENAQTSYVSLAQGSFGTHLHVAATLKKNVGEFITSLNQAGIDPDLVTTEAWAYRTILNRTLGRLAQERPILLAQLGDLRTTLYLHWKGQPVYTKEVSWGGIDLTKALSSELKLSLPEAEIAKITQGALLSAEAESSSHPDGVKISQILRKALTPLLQEMRQADLSAKNITEFNIGTVLLSGGTALLPGLLDEIKIRMRAPTENMRALHVLSNGQNEFSAETESNFFLAAALASCFLPPDRSNWINFRRGVFSKDPGGNRWQIRYLKKPIFATLAIALCFHIGAMSQKIFYDQQARLLDEKIEKIVKATYGDLNKSALKNKLASPLTVKKDMQKQVEEVRILSKVFQPDAESPFKALRGVSRTISKGMITDLIQYRAQNRKLDLTFVVKKQESAKEIQDALERQMTDFSKTELSSTELPGLQDRRWKFTVRGTPSRSLYGE